MNTNDQQKTSQQHTAANDPQMIETRFGPKPISDVIGWAIVLGVVIGVIGEFFAAWLIGVPPHV